jgi:hypothetical protein
MAWLGSNGPPKGPPGTPERTAGPGSRAPIARQGLSKRGGAVYNACVTPIFLKRLRGAAVLVLALLLVSLGVRPALAADADPTSPPVDDKMPAASGGTDDTSAKAPAEPAPTPQLQLDDEGPSARAAKKTHHGMRLTAPVATDDADEKPFWKSWVFWAVTGVIVAGAVGAVIYSTSGTRGALSPCPADVTLSLGCFGAGRM